MPPPMRGTTAWICGARSFIDSFTRADAQAICSALEDLHTIFSQVSFVNVVALDELMESANQRPAHRREPHGPKWKAERHEVRDRETPLGVDEPRVRS